MFSLSVFDHFVGLALKGLIFIEEPKRNCLELSHNQALIKLVVSNPLSSVILFWQLTIIKTKRHLLIYLFI